MRHLRNTALLAAACIGLSGPAAGAEFDHNGSLMEIDYERGAISYKVVKSSLRNLVQPGFVAFTGEIERGGAIRGTAFTFRRNCEPAPYSVSGSYDARLPGYVLTGAAPVRVTGGCRVTGYTLDSSNARLEFIDMAPDTAPDENGSAAGTATSPDPYRPAPTR